MSGPRQWASAFTGFYKPGVEEVGSLDTVSRFRSVILVISAQAARYTIHPLASGALTPFAAAVLAALPRALRAIGVMSRPRPAAPPEGYVGWPLWFHRAALVHNRLFGWAYIFGLGAGAIFRAAAA